MWTFGFFLSLVRNTGPVDGSFAQSYTTGFFSPLLELLWQQEPDLPNTQVLLSGLSAAASFCSAPRCLQSMFTWGKNPALPHSCSIHVPNLCNTFCLRCKMLVASHAHSGTKEMGSQQKAEEAKQGFREEKKAWERRRCEHRGWKQRPAIHRAVEPMAPSFLRGLLRGLRARAVAQLL